jgi:hypothetical protein
LLARRNKYRSSSDAALGIYKRNGRDMRNDREGRNIVDAAASSHNRRLDSAILASTNTQGTKDVLK